MDHPALFYLHQDLRRRLRYARHQAARHLEANPQGNPEYAWAKALERHMGDFAYDLPMFFYDQGLTEEFSALPHSAEVIVQVEQSEPPDPPRKGERYRVQSGDTLEGIARQYGITLAALYEVNPDLKAQDPRKLAVGAEVILPAGAPFGIKARIDLLVPMHEHRMIELAYHLGLIEHITGVDFLDLNYYRYGQSPYPSGWNKPFHQQSSSWEVPYQQDWHSPWSVPRDSWSAFAPSLYKSEPEHPRQRGPWNPFFLNEQQQRVGELGQQPCRFRHKDLVSPPGLSLGQSIVVAANRHIQEASPERLEELISICLRRPYQLVLEVPDVLTGINNSMSNAASFIFNLGANAWNGIAMSVNYSYAVMSGAEKNISGAEAIYQLEQYIKADYENLISDPKDYLQDTFTDLENYEDAAAALIARKFAPKGAGKGLKKGERAVKEADAVEDMSPGSPAHKAQRWEDYQGNWSYERWEKQYDVNMRNNRVGLQREVDYRSALGGSSKTLKTPYTNRQIDIFRADEMYAGQLKTGKVYHNERAIIDIQKDAWLVDEGYIVEYILEEGASVPFLEALEKNGISYIIGPQIPN